MDQRVIVAAAALTVAVIGQGGLAFWTISNLVTDVEHLEKQIEEMKESNIIERMARVETELEFRKEYFAPRGVN